MDKSECPMFRIIKIIQFCNFAYPFVAKLIVVCDTYDETIFLYNYLIIVL